MGSQPAVQVLSSIGVILDGFDPAMVGAGERLGCARLARRLASRLTAVAGLLLADAEAARESMRAAGTPTTTWLAIDRLTHARLAYSGRVWAALAWHGHDGAHDNRLTQPREV